MLEMGWWRWGIIKESFQKHLKIGSGQRQSYSKGRGDTEGVTTPAPSLNFDRTHILDISQSFNLQS